jgi:hypothetical protein
VCDIFGNAAADAAQQQISMIEAQQHRHDQAVAQGKSSIDKAFEQFTPDYFNKYKQSYIDAYNPQLKDQYGIAKDSLTASLADRDILESTPGANAFGQLSKTLNNTEAEIGNRATDASNGLRATVDNTKTNLYGLNANAADPLTVAAQAQAQSGAIVSPQSMSPLGNVFAGVLGPYAAAQKTNQSGMTPSSPLPFTQAPATGSVQIG